MEHNDNLFSLDQFTTGLAFNFPRLNREIQWRQWYENDFSTLFRAPTIANGMKHFTPAGGRPENHAILVPVFQLGSDFYTDATLTERPSYDGDEAVKEFLKTRAVALWRVLRRAVLDWSIYGRGIILAREGGVLEAPSHPEYFRIGRIWDRDELVDHVLAYRYYEVRPDSPEAKNPSLRRIPNRIRVVKYSPVQGYSTIQHFLYNGHKIGAAIDAEEPYDITALCTFGRYDSWYPRASQIAGPFMAELSAGQAILNRARNAPLRIPQSVFDALKGVGSTKSSEEVWREFQSMVWPVVGYEKEDTGTARTLEGVLPHAEGLELARFLEKMMYMATGLPPSTLGFNIGLNASGAARERASDAAVSRVHDIREELVECLPTVVAGMGAPAGEITFIWHAPPFADREAYRNEVRATYRDGIISRDAAARILGYSDADMQQEEPDDEGEEDGDGNRPGAGDPGSDRRRRPPVR